MNRKDKVLSMRRLYSLVLVASAMMSVGSAFSPALAVEPAFAVAPEKEPTFELFLVKPEDQKDVWHYADFRVDIDKLALEKEPLITGEDVASFDTGFSDAELTLKKSVKLTQPVSGTGLYFVVAVNGQREFLGHFLTGLSSLSPDDATTYMLTGFGLNKSEEVSEIRLPKYSKAINSYLRYLNAQHKHKPRTEQEVAPARPQRR